MGDYCFFSGYKYILWVFFPTTFRLLLALRFWLCRHFEEFHSVQCPEIGTWRKQNLRLRDVCRRLEVLFLLHGFRGECGAERTERPCVHDASLRAKTVQYCAEFVENGCNVSLSYGRVFRHNLTKFVEIHTLFLANRAGYIRMFCEKSTDIFEKKYGRFY